MDTLVRAKELLQTLKHAPGKHRQETHGFRFGKTPSLAKAREYRKVQLEGGGNLLQKYLTRARDVSGTKPSKQRQAEKPKPIETPKPKSPFSVTENSDDPKLKNQAIMAKKLEKVDVNNLQAIKDTLNADTASLQMTRINTAEALLSRSLEKLSSNKPDEFDDFQFYQLSNYSSLAHDIRSQQQAKIRQYGDKAFPLSDKQMEVIARAIQQGYYRLLQEASAKKPMV